MSHLKESMVISFTASVVAVDSYDLIFPVVTPFTFKSGITGSVGHVEGTAPTIAITYDIIEEITAAASIGSINIAATTGIVTFVCTGNSFIPGDVLTIKAPSNLQGMTGALGVSLVGER